MKIRIIENYIKIHNNIYIFSLNIHVQFFYMLDSYIIINKIIENIIIKALILF